MNGNPYTPYEQATLNELGEAFTSPFRTPVAALVHVVSGPPAGSPLRRRRSRRLGVLLKSALVRVDQLATSSLRPSAVFAAYRRGGHARVKTLADVRRLELWEQDEVAEHVQAKYLAGGAALGVVAGAVGVPGAALLVPLVTVLALRAIGDYALHYGYDPSTPSERKFAVGILAAALSPTSNLRSASVDELVEAGTSLARAWRREKNARVALPFVLGIAKRVFRTLLTRSDRHVVARMASRLGSIVGAGASAWLLLGVMRAARSAYRERRLA